MIKKSILLISSLILTFFILEIFLIIYGRYNNLTKTNLKPSLAKYERASSSKQIYKHPDINYQIVINFDNDGVKNFDEIPASEKNNIIGFFGDSFTENIAIKKDFEYTSILSNLNKDFNFVNYGGRIFFRSSFFEIFKI